MKLTKVQWIKRCLFLCGGLFVMALGVACSVKAGLGTSPISSVPYTVNCFTPLTVGTATILMHCLFILMQIALLRTRYQWFQLLQLPVAVLFGVLTDGAIYLLQGLPCETYIQQWLYCILGIILVAIGVSCEVTAHVVTLAGEGLVLAICNCFPVKFGNMKVAFDVSLVCISLLLSVIFLHHIAGVREGTVAAALLVGILAKQLNKPMERVSAALLS